MFIAIDTDQQFFRYINTDQITSLTLHRKKDPSYFYVSPEVWVLTATYADGRTLELAHADNRQTLARKLDEITMKANGQR